MASDQCHCDPKKHEQQQQAQKAEGPQHPAEKPVAGATAKPEDTAKTGNSLSTDGGPKAQEQAGSKHDHGHQPNPSQPATKEATGQPKPDEHGQHPGAKQGAQQPESQQPQQQGSGPAKNPAEAPSGQPKPQPTGIGALQSVPPSSGHQAGPAQCNHCCPVHCKPMSSRSHMGSARDLDSASESSGRDEDDSEADESEEVERSRSRSRSRSNSRAPPARQRQQANRRASNQRGRPRNQGNMRQQQQATNSRRRTRGNRGRRGGAQSRGPQRGSSASRR